MQTWLQFLFVCKNAYFMILPNKARAALKHHNNQVSNLVMVFSRVNKKSWLQDTLNLSTDGYCITITMKFDFFWGGGG